MVKEPIVASARSPQFRPRLAECSYYMSAIPFPGACGSAREPLPPAPVDARTLKPKKVMFGGDTLSNAHIRFDLSRFLRDALKKGRGRLKSPGVIFMVGRNLTSRFFMHWSVVAARLPRLWEWIVSEQHQAASPTLKVAGACAMVVLNHVGTAVFDALLEYVYVGQLIRGSDLSDLNMRNLYDAANLLGLTSLADLLELKAEAAALSAAVLRDLGGGGQRSGIRNTQRATKKAPLAAEATGGKKRKQKSATIVNSNKSTQRMHREMSAAPGISEELSAIQLETLLFTFDTIAAKEEDGGMGELPWPQRGDENHERTSSARCATVGQSPCPSVMGVVNPCLVEDYGLTMSVLAEHGVVAPDFEGGQATYSASSSWFTTNESSPARSSLASPLLFVRTPSVEGVC